MRWPRVTASPSSCTTPGMDAMPRLRHVACMMRGLTGQGHDGGAHSLQRDQAHKYRVSSRAHVGEPGKDKHELHERQPSVVADSAGSVVISPFAPSEAVAGKGVSADVEHVEGRQQRKVLDVRGVRQHVAGDVEGAQALTRAQPRVQQARERVGGQVQPTQRRRADEGAALQGQSSCNTTTSETRSPQSCQQRRRRSYQGRTVSPSPARDKCCNVERLLDTPESPRDAGTCGEHGVAATTQSPPTKHSPHDMRTRLTSMQ